MNRKVIIIGQGYTGRLSLVRSVAETGFDVVLIALVFPETLSRRGGLPKPLDAYSKYVSEFFYSEAYNDAKLVDLLLNHCVTPGQKNFIIPDNDFSAAAIDKHRDRLKPFFYCPHINDRQGAIEEWMDKVRQKAMAEQVGLNVVDSTLIEVKNRQYEIPESINYPCFAKPLLSMFGGKSALKKCKDAAELKKHIDFILTKRDDVKVMVEDFKRIDKEYATLGFSDGDEVVIPGLLDLMKIGHGSHFGVAVQGRVFPVDGYEDLVEKFKLLVKNIGFFGVFDIDFFESEGKFYFCELNLRFGGSGYAFTKMGVNLPVMMIKSFLGENLDGMTKTISGTATYFNERMAVDDWFLGYLTTEQLRRMKAESDITFVDDMEDPAPQRILDKIIRKKKLIRFLRKCLGRK